MLTHSDFAAPRLSAPEPIAQGPEVALRLSSLLLRRRRLLITMPIMTAAAAVLFWLVAPPRYSASASFVPEANEPSLAGDMSSGLLGQLGLSRALGGVTPIDFYAALLESREILEQVAAARYQRRDGTTAPLYEILGVRSDSLQGKVAAAARALHRRLSIDLNARAGIVQFKVTLQDPLVAQEVVQRFIDFMRDFNANKRQSRARQQREFLAERIIEAKRDLDSTEKVLEDFLTRNRNLATSPELQRRGERLRAEVDLGDQLYLTLARQYETARIEEVKNTPVLTVLDSPRGSVLRTGPSLVRQVALGLFLGAVMVLMWLMVEEYVATARRRSPADYAAVHALWAEVRRDAGGAVARVRAIFGGRGQPG